MKPFRKYIQRRRFFAINLTKAGSMVCPRACDVRDSVVPRSGVARAIGIARIAEKHTSRIH
jgi:hypothetical protein